MGLRDGVIKVLRGGVDGAEKLANAVIGGARRGIDSLDKNKGTDGSADDAARVDASADAS
jgi:hypothetical protein